MSVSSASLDVHVLRFIANSPFKVSFARLKRHVNEAGPVSTNTLKKVVTGLIQDGQLCYTCHYGRSFIEISFDRPRRVSDHVVLKSPRSVWDDSGDLSVISLSRGASFGGGEHPSTRLAIRLIDHVLHWPCLQDRKKKLRVIDIGTGSGVLAIVAAKMGVGHVCGLDTDPCARFEARNNVDLNEVDTVVNILDKDLNAIDGVYDMVFANLRAPTLCGFRNLLENIVETENLLIFSGLKSEETDMVVDFYKKGGYFLYQSACEKGWGAICLVKGALLNDTAMCI
ncbi:hypothetical protein DSCA_41280 [Desulfosarcina alkanivorans]|uniref:Ribosomal protein L11 methyltransferase n=1 Tax=Desulfosarcina alkanivorans TaxID=571177 RepID=A0A5K7YN08_9BACT|nr:50S ribosomal protein L11 methyltransferase [Desulfosarcina alkanivorans]BBO70198.1 hypothetical protein DSCA_41280 [Desulfosarcina alkanivorans]